MDDLRLLQKACPAAFYKPNKPAAEKYILSHGGLPGSKSTGDRPFFESDARLRISIGGNRAGKTTKLILEAGSTAVGRRPWYHTNDQWQRRGLPRYEDRGQGSFKKVVRIRYVVPNFGVHLPEVVAELEKWWPADWWQVKSRDDRGTPREISWFTGAKMLFMSHHMDPSDFEGVEADLNVWDEPPPPELWVALERGVVSTGGRTVVGATLLDASGWFWDDVVTPGERAPDKDILVSWHSIWDNTAENGGCPTQTAENVRQWLEYKIADPDERLAREHGSPMHIGGLVLSNFSEKNLVDPFDLSDANVLGILGSIDPAGRRPFAGLFIAFIRLPDGTIEGHLFDEVWDPRMAKDLQLFGEVWNQKESGEMEPKHPCRSTFVLIDPYAEEPQKADRYGRTMRRILFEDYGIETSNANRQGKRGRLLSLNTRVGKLQYKVWKTLRRTRMETKKWTWDPDSPKLTKGTDDMMDNWSYMDGADPFKVFSSGKDGFDPSGIWVPDEYKTREARRKKLYARD